METHKKRGSKLYEVGTLAQEISHGRLLSWVDVTLLEDTQG